VGARPDSLFETRTRLPPVPPGTEEVLLVFGLTRSRLHGIEPADLPADLAPDAEPPVEASTLRLRVLEPRQAPIEFPADGVRVLSSVEPAQLVKVIFRNADFAEVYADPADMCPGRSGRFAQVSVGGSTFLDAAAYVAEYEQALQREPELAPYRRFFLELDRNSHSKLLDLRLGDWTWEEVRQAKVAVDETMRELRARVVLRRDRFVQDQAGPAVLGAIPDIRRGHLGRISALKLRLMRDQLGIADPAHDDLTPLWEAFARFASGDLRVRMASHAYGCQPSTGFFFLFGELALLCVDSDVAAATWTRIAPALVAAREIFVDVYHPQSDGPHDFDDINACNFDPERRRVWTPQALRELQASFAALDHAALSARSCLQIGTYLSGVSA
jgi:hypothetical protein